MGGGGYKKSLRIHFASSIYKFLYCFATTSMAYFFTTDSCATAPSFWYCASQDCYFFGYKLHALCGISGVIHSYDMSNVKSRIKRIGNLLFLHLLRQGNGWKCFSHKWLTNLCYVAIMLSNK